MRKLVRGGAVLLLAAVTLNAADPRPGQTPDAERVAALIAQLGSGRFADRETAARELEALGPIVREPLRTALEGDDAEVRRRARQLLRKIDLRQEATQLLQPQRLRLLYRATPLAEALADFSQRTGFDFQLEDRDRLVERRVTLDTGELPCWEALAVLCRKAGLVERVPDAVPLWDDWYGSSSGERRIQVRGDIRGLGFAPPDNRIILKEGEPRPLPTYQADAVRVQALPPATPLLSPAKAGGETLLALEVRIEPRFRLQSVLALRIDKAIDDRDQVLTQPPDAVAAPGSSSGGGDDEVLIFWDGVTELPSTAPGDARRVPVRLRPASKPGARLKELRGTLALQVKTPPETLLTVDQLLRSAGRGVTGRDGSAVKVTDIRREDGKLRLQVEVAVPSSDPVLGGVPARIVLSTRGLWSGWAEPPGRGAQGLSLFDAAGRMLPVEVREGRGAAGAGSAREYVLTCPVGPNQEEPERLVLAVPRSVTVEVPFVLRDIPLP